MKMTLRNSNEGVKQMRQLWVKMKESLDSGVALTVQVERENRTLDQNAMYHSIIHQIAKQAQHLGSTWDADDFKRLLVWQWAKEVGISPPKIVPSLDGEGFVQLGLQTRKFTKQQASEFTEWLMAWCAQNGVDVK